MRAIGCGNNVPLPVDDGQEDDEAEALRMAERNELHDWFKGTMEP
jgi:hypothetical protein